MKENNKKEIWKKQKRRYRMTTRIAFGLIAVFFLYMSAVIIALQIAAGFGVDIERIPSPRIAFFNIFLLCMIYAIFATYYMTRRIFRPLEELNKASRQVAKGDFSVRLEYEGGIKEFKDTMDNFNRMIKEIDSVEIMRNDFIADVSHEFKTPLSAISGYATFLQDPELPEDERSECIRKIFFNIGKLNDLTDNILRLSKLEHKQYEDEPVSYRLDEQIREAVVLLEPKWSKKNIDFEIDMPEIVFKGQKSLLFQVWTNIIGNAIKYTDAEGKVSIYLKRKNDNVRVIVSDNGIGMSEATQKHIFDKFYQGDTSRKAQGNGLGLALCKEIVTKCGGNIYVESKAGVGSVFIVQLPDGQQAE